MIMTMRRLHQNLQQRNSVKRRRRASIARIVAIPAQRRLAVMAGYGSKLLSYSVQTWPVGFCLKSPNVGVATRTGTNKSTSSGRLELFAISEPIVDSPSAYAFAFRSTSLDPRGGGG